MGNKIQPLRRVVVVDGVLHQTFGSLQKVRPESQNCDANHQPVPATRIIEAFWPFNKAANDSSKNKQ